VTNKRRNLIFGGIAALSLLAFFTNPNQAAHLSAIKETVALRKPDGASEINSVLMPLVHYNNYVVFSTTTPGNKDTILSYGYFGQVQTTDDIGILFGVP
jgi:hypothetical protein